MGRAGRKRNAFAKRDKNGKNREPRKTEDARIVALKPRIRDFGRDIASDPLCGHCLGQLHLAKHITVNQLHTGERFGALLRRHAGVMGLLIGHPRSAALELVGIGTSCGLEPDEEQILTIRRQIGDCYRALFEAGRPFRRSIRLANITRDAALDIIQASLLLPEDIGFVQMGLNVLHPVFR